MSYSRRYRSGGLIEEGKLRVQLALWQLASVERCSCQIRYAHRLPVNVVNC